MSLKPILRRAVSILMVFSIVGMYAFSVLGTRPALAAGDAPSSAAAGAGQVSTAICRGLNTAVTPDTCEGLNEAANQVDDKLIKPAMQVALLTALLNIATFAIDRVAYEAAVWIATGGEGETPLFNGKDANEAWKEFGLDIVGETIGQLNDEVMSELNVEFDICAPENPLFKLSIQLGLKQAYQPTEPKCDFQDIRKNWESFISTTAQTASNPSATVLKAFAEGFKPGQNELSAVVGLNIKVHQRVLEAKTNKLFEQVNSGGFKSVTDIVTGQVKTPSSVLQSEFNRTLEYYNEEPTNLHMQVAIQNADLLGNMFLHVAGVFTNTLLSTLMNRIYTGLFDVQPEIDPFNQELAGITSREDASNRFSSFVTVSPAQVDNYNVLAEFVACPVGPVATRGLNNCVMDANFLSAVSRAESGTPLTVQDAIDDGLVNGGWALIPHEGDGIPQNQDPLCYSYGYCYGNLVKMRKARVIPVGWEIAASRNDPSNPATLQQIVDGFDDCGEQGSGLDASHPWCHLIDPNWVLKYPETQCRALVNGELQISSLSAGRAGACADMPSCIAESNDGTCDGGYGYCVQEQNVWRFRGEECPAEYASCLAFENTDTGSTVNYLYNTVDESVCDAENAGCEWYRTNQYASGDGFAWLPAGETYLTAERADDVLREDPSTGAAAGRTAYAYDADGDGTADGSYATYAYEDRVYFNNNVSECASSAAGCSAVYRIADSLALNALENASFETDDNGDSLPDGWAATGATLDASGSRSAYGSRAISATGGSISQANVQIGPGNFYTLSFYARQDGSGDADAVSATVALTDRDGNDLDLGGTSVAGDCAVTGWMMGSENAVRVDAVVPEDDSYERFFCTFTVPDQGNGAVAEVFLESEDGTAWFDAVQLELGDDASGFAEAYNASSPSVAYLRVAPEYLGCTGSATDPAECADYAQACEAQDVGCNLYVPDDGDPSITAVASSLDACPSECVGYTSYKQEATERDAEEFPLYFIADRAAQCGSQYVGCDAFTNLDAAAEGGEGSETYSYLRACVTPDMATGTSDGNVTATYFTWEGSDASGYQLVTWTLLQSDDDDAPCVEWDVRGEDTLVCAEDAGEDYETDTCDSHADIFENPDCREFYGTDGSIYYRDVTDTVAVDAECHPYRLDGSSADDCEGSGGFWTDAGDCRYFGLPEESTECPAAQAGCREYTGGAGRNASTAFNDDMEDGALSEYYENAGVTMTVSNESIATGGHSLRAEFTSQSAITTNVQYLDWDDRSVTYDGTAATCSDLDSHNSETGDGCLVDHGTGNACTVKPGDNNCGALDDALVEGKTYVLSFLAKGSAPMWVTMIEEGGTGDTHDFVTPADGDGDDTLALDGGWQTFELGPLDTSDFDAFGDDAIISFGAEGGAIVYLDNIRLQSVEENVTLLKDSWIVPSTCDQTPDGAESPQYYLGCEGYADQDGNDVSLYQFSDLCSEEVVGCEAVYDTQNSDSPRGAVYNARCEYVSDATLAPAAVAANVTCELEGAGVCTISAGDSFCLFDRDGAIPSDLPSTATSGGRFAMAIGPEAAVVDNDLPLYLVDDGTASCSAENVGCEEIGLPEYNQDKSQVTGFASAYVINDPDQYADVLCGDQELFCEEWSSTQDGNFYFKDPVDQTCAYANGVTVNGTSYTGWFRSGTTEPCDPGYVEGGSELGIWRNGDPSYAGWVGECGSSYDLCTEFTDLSDTSEGTYPAGTPYYFLDDDSMSEEALTASEQCQGRVSQKEGCGLFRDANDAALLSNASASYAASVHADELFGDAPGSMQDPVSCQDGGSDIVTPEGDAVNLCEQRCGYTLESGDSLTRPGVDLFAGTWYDGSCYDATDCPTLETDGGDEVAGTCVVGLTGTFALENDSNRVIKVYRDRECAAWLSCQSAQVSWNQRTARYETVCDRIGLCTRYTRSGDSSYCTEWADTDAVPLDAAAYASRNVTWNGNEYSGFAIPEQLPVEHYDQVNVAPDTTDTVCASAEGEPLVSDGSLVECDTILDCNEPGFESCLSFRPDFRLAYSAGACDMGDEWGGDCVVGVCAEGGNSCGDDSDCWDGDACVVGYCQYVDRSVDNCTDSSQCAAPYGVCDTVTAKCVNALAPNDNTCVTASDCTSLSGGTCTPDVRSLAGSCLNGECLTGLDGNPLSVDSAREMECRGYPESNSPFPSQVVAESQGWLTPADMIVDGEDLIDTMMTESSPSRADSQPYSFLYGFQSVDVCSPIWDENDVDGDGNREEYVPNDECLCSYTKVTYGNQSETRYYQPNAADVLEGICVGGDFAGMECPPYEGDTTCGSAGTCAARTRTDAILGWEGYCLEKDVSIQLYGSAAEEDRACLTWLPVDQLAGSTDLYGKYLEAGYAPQDTYYCAEIQDAYDIGVVSTDAGPACAESYGDHCADGGGHGDGGWDSFIADADESCVGSVWCPDGWFAVMTGCATLSQTDGPGDYPSEEERGDRECSDAGSRDEDCPFYCVPKGARKTEVDTISGIDSTNTEIGQSCLPPYDLMNAGVLPDHFVLTGGQFNEGSYDAEELAYNYGTDRAFPDGYATGSYEGSQPGFDIYLVKDYMGVEGGGYLTFNDLHEYYDDCAIRGIVGEEHIEDYLYPLTSALELIAFDPTQPESSAAYKNLNFNVRRYAACTAVVQTARTTADSAGNYNYAWTDRVWPAGPTDDWAAIQDADSRFEYSVATPQAIFGRATDLMGFLEAAAEDSIDLYPLEAVMCEAGTVGGVTAECSPDGELDIALTSTTGIDAQPYYDVQLGGMVGYAYIGGTANQSFCTDESGTVDGTGGDPVCECDLAAADESDCNEGISCEDTDGTGGGDTCAGGPNAGASCERNADCYEFICADDMTVTTIDGTRTSGPGCAAVDSSGSDVAVGFEAIEGPSDAISRLSQIFTNAMDVWFFRDGFAAMDALGLSPRDPVSALITEGTADWIIGGGEDYLKLNDSLTDETDEELARFLPWVYDNPTGEGDAAEDPGVPRVYALGACEGTHCLEGDADAFSVDGFSSGVVRGSEGYEYVTVSFFVEGDEEQMPLRNIIVDWGDGDFRAGETAWPFGSASGSTATSNYYKNHRGYDIDDQPICGSGDDWSLSSGACDSSYVTFSNNYTCSIGKLNDLEEQGRYCEYVTDPDGSRRLLNSPCVGGTSVGGGVIVGEPKTCVFQPRVHVKDNWGWCTGYCDSGDGSTECYGNECAPTECPSIVNGGGVDTSSSNTCPDKATGDTVNPWINFNGYVQVSP